MIALDLTDDVADVLWSRKTGGDVQTVAVYNDRVLMGGHSQVKDGDSGPGDRGFASRPSTSTGPRPGRRSSTGRSTGLGTFLVRGNQVWVGGAFKTVSGIAQSNIARFTDVP